MSNGHYVVPKLVQDNTLKSLITTVNGEDALKVKEVAQGEVDLDPITDALGDPSDSTYSSGDGTIISLLKGIYEDFHPPTPTPAPIVSHFYNTATKLTGWQTPASSTQITVPSNQTIVYFSSSVTDYVQLYYIVNSTSSDYQRFIVAGSYYIIVNSVNWSLRFEDQDHNRMGSFPIYANPGSIVAHPVNINFPYDLNSIIN